MVNIIDWWRIKDALTQHRLVVRIERNTPEPMEVHEVGSVRRGKSEWVQKQRIGFRAPKTISRKARGVEVR